VKKCEAELKLLRKTPAAEAVADFSFSSVCQTLSQAIDAGMVPEQGLQTLKDLAPSFQKFGLSTDSPLSVSLGLGDKLSINVLKVNGESTCFEVRRHDRVMDLKCLLKPPFGTRVHLNTEDNTPLDDAQTFAEAGVRAGDTLTVVFEKLLWAKDDKSAIRDVMEFLEDGEIIEAVVFGKWGWGGYEEMVPPAVPMEKIGEVLMPYEAGSYMKGWSFYGGHGAPECYAAYIYTNLRVLFPSQYDGATRLNGIPLRPARCSPKMPGG